ncbi:MAG: hypothetical protein NZ658_08385 [Pirellulales bacterium]|nr:hypothetical protein [Pirellulales bacterium]
MLRVIGDRRCRRCGCGDGCRLGLRSGWARLRGVARLSRGLGGCQSLWRYRCGGLRCLLRFGGQLPRWPSSRRGLGSLVVIASLISAACGSCRSLYCDRPVGRRHVGDGKGEFEPEGLRGRRLLANQHR